MVFQGATDSPEIRRRLLLLAHENCGGSRFKDRLVQIDDSFGQCDCRILGVYVADRLSSAIGLDTGQLIAKVRLREEIGNVDGACSERC